MLLEAHRAGEGGVDPALESEDLAPDEVVVVGPGDRVRVRVWVGLGLGLELGSGWWSGLASGTMPCSMKTALRARCGCSRRKASKESSLSGTPHLGEDVGEMWGRCRGDVGEM